jgi:hypothetical protein
MKLHQTVAFTPQRSRGMCAEYRFFIRQPGIMTLRMGLRAMRHAKKKL